MEYEGIRLEKPGPLIRAVRRLNISTILYLPVNAWKFSVDLAFSPVRFGFRLSRELAWQVLHTLDSVTEAVFAIDGVREILDHPMKLLSIRDLRKIVEVW